MVLKRIWQHLNLRRRVQIWFLLILMICTSFAEVLSIGAVLPFLGVLTSPDIVFNKVELLPFINKLDIKSSDQLLLPLTLVFIFATLLAGFMRLVLVWAQYSLSSAIGADLSLDMYRRTLYQPYAVHVARNSSSLITAISSKADSFIGSL
jgi:ATP-binding cassette subfamily B protein